VLCKLEYGGITRIFNILRCTQKTDKAISRSTQYEEVAGYIKMLTCAIVSLRSRETVL
jgi:hypothetical protein